MQRRRGVFEIVSPAAALLGRAPRVPAWQRILDWAMATVEAAPWSAANIAIVLAPAALVLVVLGAAGAFR